MKRIVLATVALAFIASSAVAGPLVAPHWTWTPVKFRTHLAAVDATVGLNSGVDNLGGYYDSLSVSKGAASALDTTIAFATAGWNAPVGAAPDTSISVSLNIFDAGNTASGSGTDSLYVYPQGSFDGKKWFSLAVVPSVAPIAAVPGAIAGAASPNGVGLITQEGSAASTKAWTLRFPSVNVGTTRSLQSVYDLTRIPLIRFIIQQDASAVAVYNLKATLGHWSSDEDLNR